MISLAWPLTAVFLFLLYLLSLAVYRLVFSPIAKFPGPRLAALSNWYEFYWDVVKQGQFTFHIQELHKKYGEFVTRARTSSSHSADIQLPCLRSRPPSS